MNKQDWKSHISIEGECVGVDFIPRGKKDNHVCLDIYIEDDETWFKKMTLSSYWIDDFIKVLQQTKEKLQSDFDKDPSGFGYRYMT